MQSREVFNKLALLCSRKEYCSFDLLLKMQRWDLSTNIQEAVIEDLKKEKYLDEKRFSEAFVKDKFQFNKWGKQKIKYQLKQKKISEQNIENAITQITEEDYGNTIDRLLKAKNKNIKAKDPYEHKTKLLRFMAQRGFEIEEILKRLEKLDLI